MLLANLWRLRRCCTSLPLLLGIVVVLGVCSSQVSTATRSKVEYLPGLRLPDFRHDESLPFELETGYIGVGESEDVQLFYYFVKSESNPSIDPIVVWISGGPGCSAFLTMTQEIGPLFFDPPRNNWTLPTLTMSPYSWTKVASFIYLDLPVGTGFSYVKSSKNYTSNSVEAGDHAVEFIRKWLIDHFEYQSNSFYVGGDSYSGITVPMVAQAISNAIEDGIKPHIDLKGYLIGNGLTYTAGYYYLVQFARELSLIPYEFYESILEECGGNTLDIDLNCWQYLEEFLTLTFVNSPGITLETSCDVHIKDRMSAGKGFRGFNAHALDPYICCRGEEVASRWINDDSVREALHVRKGSVVEWKQCNQDGLQYEVTVDDSRPYHANLSKKGYRSLIYSGDNDMLVPSRSAEVWTKSLNYSIVDDWRPWFVNDQIVGYTRTFSNNMTYAKIKGSAHSAPTFTPLECLIMFKRWISSEKL